MILIADASGATLTTNRYDEYGQPQATNAGRFGYTGQQWLPELGLNYYKARMYAPHLGRFLQTDPIGYDGGINLYAYVSGDPVNMTDPDGQEGIFEEVGDYAKMVAHDIGELGDDIIHGDFEHAFGGMPPTLGGGLSTLGTLGRTATMAKVVGREASVSRAAAGELNAAKSVTPRTTRSGERAIKVVDRTGREKDISPTRVKERVPNTHPKAPPGKMQRVRFRNAQPGSKDLKRDPRPVEQRMLEMREKPGLICRVTGFLC